MQARTRSTSKRRIGGFVLLLSLLGSGLAASAQDADLIKRKEAFGLQLFHPAEGFVLEQGQPLPALVWENPGLVDSLTEDATIHTRWYNTHLEEATSAADIGRYYAYGEATGPDGLPFRRGMTCVSVADADLPSLAEQRIKFAGIDAQQVRIDSTVNAWQRTESGAVELAAILESGLTATESRLGQWQMENATRQVKLKRKVLGHTGDPVSIAARRLPSLSPVLRSGTLAETGISPEKVKAIESQLDSWYASAGQPTSIVISRNGVIVLDRSYGDLEGRPVTSNTPMLLHSAMKPLIGCLLAMYVDRGLIDLDEPMGNHLVDFATPSDRNLTYRAGQVHATGIRFPWPLAFSRLFYFETWHEGLIAHQPREWAPGAKRQYGVVGVILSVRAMELMSGMNYWDAMEHELFTPMGIRNILPGGTGFSAENLARIGVMLENKGKYGEVEFFSEATHKAILPTALTPYFPDINIAYGIGLQSYDNRFGPGSYGHGGGCGTQLIVFPNEGIVFSMVRNNQGENYKAHLADTIALLNTWTQN